MIIVTANVHPFLIETLKNKGYEVLYEPGISYEDLYEKIEKVTGLVVTTRINIDKSIINKAVRLKWIGRLGSGLELIDLKYVKEKKILCVSTPEGNSNAVAEHTLGLLLNLMNNITKSHVEVCHNIWLREENRGTELNGKTVGIIGYGNTGQAFAKLLVPFDVTILVYDKYKFGFGSGVIEEVDFGKICRDADVISFHVPLTDETLYMADDAFYLALKKKPFILNTSRGKVVKTTSLIKGLKEDKIRGVALDVLENENINSLDSNEKDDFLFLKNQPNVILTPHIAGYSYESFYKMTMILIEKLGI